MIKKYFLIFFIFISVCCFAQHEFAPIGATWYFDNTNGQQVLAVENCKAIDVSNLNRGVYFLKILDKERNFLTKRFIHK
ncbi:MAG: hypothetical protein PF436_00885 [Prolixibacteraceae bacterium]|jgi:hypothetical protein|nr:hypothetical protein [Prolixibacteraceae bacterium]